jgi:hypothetical protein
MVVADNKRWGSTEPLRYEEAMAKVKEQLNSKPRPKVMALIKVRPHKRNLIVNKWIKGK